MAKSSVRLYPWEPRSGKDADMRVSENESIRNALSKNTPAILKTLDLSDKFWSLLVLRDVVDEDIKTNMQSKKKNKVQPLSLVQHMMEVEVYKFHGFIWALVNSHQCDLAELLGFDVNDYLDLDINSNVNVNFEAKKKKARMANLNIKSEDEIKLETGQPKTCPWEPDSGGDADMRVIENESICDALTKNTSAILNTLDLSEKFWSLLFQRGVVDGDIKASMQVKETNNIQPQLLIQQLMEVKVYKFHGFIWALVNSNQCHLAELLGFDVRDYLDVEVYLKSSSFQCPACCDFYTKAYVLTGCGHYVCAPCVKGAKFICNDNQNEDITCPVPECLKVTETPPSAGGIGLEEDDNFGDLCQALLKEVRKKSTETTSTTVKKEEEEMSTTGREEKVGLSQPLQGSISGLKTKISSLQKYRAVLEKYKPGVKDYITGAIKKVKQKVDEQGKETLAWYSSLCQKVEKNLQNFVKWQNAASELSVIIKARPELLEGCLKMKVTLPKEPLTDAEEQLIAQLDAGCPIPSLLTRFPYITKLPVKAKFLLKHPLQDLEDHAACYKLAWMPDCSMHVLTNIGVWTLELNIDTAECTEAYMFRNMPPFGKPIDMSAATDGTWILSWRTQPTIQIRYPGVETRALGQWRPEIWWPEIVQWRPEGVGKPHQLFINDDYIFVGECDTSIIRSYTRKLVYVDQYDIGTDDFHGEMIVTERGKLVRSSEIRKEIYAMDLESKETSTFGGEREEDEECFPTGICTINDEYFLVCDWTEDHVSVFTHDGQFVHHLDVEGDLEMPHKVAVLARSGQPTLMALIGADYESYYSDEYNDSDEDSGSDDNNDDNIGRYALYVYTLE